MAFVVNRPAKPLRATVLTSFVGFHGVPSLSPDGNQFAFAWDGDVPKSPVHIYIRLVGKGTPLRLTPENEAATLPSWSPDGQSIAYVRTTTLTEKGGVFVMPALGGPSRRISTGGVGSAPSWSPDSKWLVWSHWEGGLFVSLRVSPAGGGEVRQLLDPPVAAYDSGVAVSPTGREVVWNRCKEAFDCELYVAGFDNGRLTGPPRQLMHDHKGKISPVWTSDGKEILYVIAYGPGESSELSMYRVSVAGGEPRRIEGIGANAKWLTMAAKSNRLLYSTVLVNHHIRRVDLTAPDSKAERFLSSTRFEGEPAYSPDGKRIAFSSNRSGTSQIWVADADGGNLSPLTSFSDGRTGSPKWSPDGQTIAFDARQEGKANVYTVPAGGGPVKQLTNSAGIDHIPSWSPDGKWIYFGSTRLGKAEVFRMRPDGAGVQRMTNNNGFFGAVTPDGKWLYYTVVEKGVWRMPAGGGEAVRLAAPALLADAYKLVVRSQGIYTVGLHQPQGFPFVFYPFDGSAPQTLTYLDRLPYVFPDISPDGHWLLYSSADDPVYGIMLVENFR